MAEIQVMTVFWHVWAQVEHEYLFSPRKSPPTPIGRLGEGAHKVPTYDSTLLPIILHHHIREFH
jgi:ppGpp synthetase/RelA/SpoT-type nucleotidyltranferase